MSELLPLPDPKVIFQPVADGAVLLDTSGEVYFGLNAVGALVWQRLPPVASTMAEVCLALAEKYPEVGVETLRADVEEMLAELAQFGLVHPIKQDEDEAQHVGSARSPAA